jgi:hypothetical protein
LVVYIRICALHTELHHLIAPLNIIYKHLSGQLFEYLMSDECEFMLLHDLWVLRHKIGGTKVFVNNVQWSDQMM